MSAVSSYTEYTAWPKAVIPTALPSPSGAPLRVSGADHGAADSLSGVLLFGGPGQTASGDLPAASSYARAKLTAASAQTKRPQSAFLPLCLGNVIISDICTPFAMEVFCGSAVLTRALRNIGFDAFGFDEKGAKLSPVTPAIVYVNLLTAAGQRAPPGPPSA